MKVTYTIAVEDPRPVLPMAAGDWQMEKDAVLLAIRLPLIEAVEAFRGVNLHMPRVTVLDAKWETGPHATYPEHQSQAEQMGGDPE